MLFLPLSSAAWRREWDNKGMEGVSHEGNVFCVQDQSSVPDIVYKAGCISKRLLLLNIFYMKLNRESMNSWSVKNGMMFNKDRQAMILYRCK